MIITCYLIANVYQLLGTRLEDQIRFVSIGKENSQENTCVRVSFLIKLGLQLYYKRDSGTSEYADFKGFDISTFKVLK